MPKKSSSKNTHALERELLDPVMNYFRQLGCDHVVSELRFFDRGIDVYATRKSPARLTYAIELKLANWERAIQQAAVYQLCCDYSYIAVPLPAILQLDMETCARAGIGVLIVRTDGSVGELLAAGRSKVSRSDYVKVMRDLARQKDVYARE